MDIDAEAIHQTILEINEVEEKICYLTSRLDKLKAKLEELQDYDVYLSWDDGDGRAWSMSTDEPFIWRNNVIKMKVSDARKLQKLLNNK